MNKKHLLVILLFAANCAIAQVKQTVSKSSVIFQIKNLGFKTTGSIDVIQADIQFDPANLTTSNIEASADMNTINTDNDLRDKHLKSDEFFDVPDYPKITMKSVSFNHRSGGNYTGQFNLTIKKTSHMVEIPFSYTATDSTATFKGSFKIKRSDYGVGGHSFSMSDDVTVNIEVETSRQGVH